jgi:hypothetical protein
MTIKHKRHYQHQTGDNEQWIEEATQDDNRKHYKRLPISYAVIKQYP